MQAEEEATPEAIAHIMVQKFVMSSPLYRQEQELKRQGIPLSDREGELPIGQEKRP